MCVICYIEDWWRTHLKGIHLLSKSFPIKEKLIVSLILIVGYSLTFETLLDNSSKRINLWTARLWNNSMLHLWNIKIRIYRQLEVVKVRISKNLRILSQKDMDILLLRCSVYPKKEVKKVKNHKKKSLNK